MEEKDTITLKFEVLQGAYKLVDTDGYINNFIFDINDLTEDSKALDTQNKLEYILYRKRNEIKLKEMKEKNALFPPDSVI